MVPNFRNFVFSRNFAVWQIRGCWFQIWQYFCQVFVQKYPNQACLIPNLRIFILHQTLQLDKFDGVDFKYDNGSFELKPKNTQIKHFLSKIKVFFCMKLCILKNLRVLISKMAIVLFKFQLKIPKYQIFFENSKVFSF